MRKGLLCALSALLGAFVLASTAAAGGPYMLVGAADDLPKAQDAAFAKSELDLAKLAGLDAIRVTQTWTKGQTTLGPGNAITLGNAVTAAQFSGVRLILSLYPFGSSVTPLTDQDRKDFASFVVDVAKRYPYVHDFIIGNEPNLNRFWLPQFGPNGEDVAAPAYEQLLATTYDALKAARPHSTIYGGALAPRGVDRPGTGRDTHSPTAFVSDLGAAYRAGGRQVPIMDAFAFHPYPESSSIGPVFPHPNSTAIGLADYQKLVNLLGVAFDGTAQRGSGLPILYDEFGIETQIPPAKAALYTGKEPATTKPVDEATQGRMYTEAMQTTFCQPTVIGLLLFHFQDEPALSAWQSGVYYVDGTAKASLPAVAAAAAAVHRGVIASCPAMHLSPKVTLKRAASTATLTRIALTCSIDCTYRARFDAHTILAGSATGGVPKLLLLRGALVPGTHQLVLTATAVLNVGPPTTATLTFRT